MDIATISALLGSLKSASDIAKGIKEAGASLQHAEANLKLADLVGALADARLEAADVQQLILERDKEIRELKEAAKIRASLVWRQPSYFMTNATGGEDAFCQVCYDSNGKLARLHTDGEGCFRCKVCQNAFKTERRKKSDDEAISRASNNAKGQSWMG